MTNPTISSRAKELRAAHDIAHHVHPFTQLRNHVSDGPFFISRGEGVRVFDESGKGYIEGMAGLSCTALGFGEERLVSAATRQMQKLPFYHSFNGMTPDIVAEFCEKLLSIAPVPMSKVLFANSGSEANDTAVKIIWYINNAMGRPKKKKIIARQKAYHGVTVASGSLTGLPAVHGDFDLPINGFLRTDCPHYYRYGRQGESEVDFATRCAENLEKLILSEGPETVAAFFAEPVSGTGGVLVPPATYYEKIQAVLKKYDVLFVADEVICGYGRTGNMWGSETFDLRPDMITSAKGITSAYFPMSALMISEPIFDAMLSESDKLGIFGHGYTYSGHPVAAAVALEVLSIYEERDIVGHVRKAGSHMRKELEALSDHPLVGEVRGVGLQAAVEIVRQKETKESFSPEIGVCPQIVRRAREHGLLTRVIGDANAIGFVPPLIISEPEIDEMISSFKSALDETLSWVRDQRLID